MENGVERFVGSGLTKCRDLKRSVIDLSGLEAEKIVVTCMY